MSNVAAYTKRDQVYPGYVNVTHGDDGAVAAKAFCDVLEAELPEGPDKTFLIRNHRSNAMWANVAITRQPDGSPRA